MELQARVGVLPDLGLHSATYASRIATDLASESRFTTDDNFFQRMQRTANATGPAPMQGNTYPLVGTAAIQDTTTQGALPGAEGGQASTHKHTTTPTESLALAVGRSVGVTAANGAITSMLHRRLLIKGEDRGNDTSVVDDPMDAVLGATEDVEALRSQLAARRGS